MHSFLPRHVPAYVHAHSHIQTEMLAPTRRWARVRSVRSFIADMAFAVLVLAMPLDALHAQTARFTRGDGAEPRSIDLVNGDAPGLVIRGATASDTVTVRAYRRFLQQRTVNEKPVVDTVLFASWARFVAGTDGRVVVDSTAPVAGTWDRADALGAFWSMQPVTSDSVGAMRTSLRSPPRGTVELLLEQRGRIVDSIALRTVVPADRLVETTVVNGTIAGAYAAPRGARSPALIVLHGSEGGDTTSAKSLARRFALRGFATFALVYVAYPYVGAFPNVPSTFTDIPVESLDRARAWLGLRPEADTSRTGIWGVSKGAELALVTASRRTWPAAIVACVPSDVVWSGFGRAAAPGEALSSWSDGGRSLRAIPYDNYDDVFARKATARQVHDRSRVRFASAVEAATIDLRGSAAPLLLLGAEDDETWASAAMARNIASSLARTGLGRRVHVETFARAGHGMCGDGTTPAAYFGAGPVPDPRATAAAASVSWQRTIAFLRATLAQ